VGWIEKNALAFPPRRCCTLKETGARVAPTAFAEGRSWRIVVIGGAGFIGSHLVDALIELGQQVRIIDNLDPQVHPTGRISTYLNPAVEFVHQDIRDIDGLRSALENADAIFYSPELSASAIPCTASGITPR
jgi:5,10-methylene-tetrahydrofolate dehydrogenase/methenyl tetrahydrofolate cyclohydrolase